MLILSSGNTSPPLLQGNCSADFENHTTIQPHTQESKSTCFSSWWIFGPLGIARIFQSMFGYIGVLQILWNECMIWVMFYWLQCWQATLGTTSPRFFSVQRCSQSRSKHLWQYGPTSNTLRAALAFAWHHVGPFSQGKAGISNFKIMPWIAMIVWEMHCFTHSVRHPPPSVWWCCLVWLCAANPLLPGRPTEWQHRQSQSQGQWLDMAGFKCVTWKAI